MTEQAGGFRLRTNLRDVLTDLKEFDPKLATATRRRLRQAGDEAIADMRDVLAEPSLGVVTSTRTGLTRRRLDGSVGARRIRVVGIRTASASRSRSRGARADVASSLRTRVTAGQSRQKVRIVAAGSAFARSYNKTTWRHPIRFNPATTTKSQVPWVTQAGRPYFGAVVVRRRAEIFARIEEAVAEALDAVATRNVHLT